MRSRSIVTALIATGVAVGISSAAHAQATAKKPNILIIMGDDIGWYNPSIYHRGMMGYQTPNIDRIGREGAWFSDWYGQQSCTAGRAAFLTGQSPIRTGLTKVGLPGADLGLRPEDPTIAEVLKPLGYATGQFGKNHLGDKDEFLPTAHGFDEFFGNLYHLNAEEEPENADYPKNPEFRKRRTALVCERPELRDQAAQDPRSGHLDDDPADSRGPCPGFRRRHRRGGEREDRPEAPDDPARPGWCDEELLLEVADSGESLSFRARKAVDRQNRPGNHIPVAV
jgi:hypothetical protein